MRASGGEGGSAAPHPASDSSPTSPVISCSRVLSATKFTASTQQRISGAAAPRLRQRAAARGQSQDGLRGASPAAGTRVGPRRPLLTGPGPVPVPLPLKHKLAPRFFQYQLLCVEQYTHGRRPSRRRGDPGRFGGRPGT